MKNLTLTCSLLFTALSIGCSSGPQDEDTGDGDNATGGNMSLSSGGSGGTGSGGLGSGGLGSGGLGSGGLGSGGLGSGGLGTGGDSTDGTGGDSTGGTGGDTGTGGSLNEDCEDTGAAENFSFFVTSWHHMELLSGSSDGFGGDLRYGGATDGLTGADNICQEIARRVCHGHKTWKAYLSTSTVNAITRIGTGPWYDYAGTLVANDTSGLLGEDARPAGGCCDSGTYDEIGIFHDGTTDINNDGIEDDDHDVMTATNSDGEYDGFSCDDWTSTTALPEGSLEGQGGLQNGLRFGHSWPAFSGQGWQTVHAGHACGAGTNFIQDFDPNANNASTVGGGGGYGAIYCFAID